MPRPAQPRRPEWPGASWTRVSGSELQRLFGFFMLLRCGDFQLPLARPLVMGIVNLTPDSFSGDGLASDTARAIARAHRQIEEGADLLDIGAESSRPGAIPTTVEEELGRLLPVLEALADAVCRFRSIPTSLK
jgi:dihydropteroate synthase